MGILEWRMSVRNESVAITVTHLVRVCSLESGFCRIHVKLKSESHRLTQEKDERETRREVKTMLREQQEWKASGKDIKE